MLSTDETAIAPKAICESPSPIIECLFKTRDAPKSEDEKAISIPTINEFTTNGYEKY
jgi:hypothetical protein